MVYHYSWHTSLPLSPCLSHSRVSSASSPSLAPWFSPSSGYCSRNDLPCSELSAWQHKHARRQTHTGDADTHNRMRANTCRTHLILPPPSLLGPPSRRTDWEQSLNAGRRLHSLLLLPLFFLPPLTQHPSLSISITPAAFHRLSLLYPLPSPLLLRLPLFPASLSTGPPPAFPFSFFFSSTYEVQTSAPSSPPCLPLFVFLFYFISEFHLGERGIQQVRSDKKQIKVITQSSPRSLARCSSIYNIFFNPFFLGVFLSFFRTAETRAKRH